MKRSPEVGGNLLPTLQDMVLIHIVSAFNNEESMRWYLGALKKRKHERVRQLIEEKWRLKNIHPDKTLVQNKRRFLEAELVVRYMDTRELIAEKCIIHQTQRTHITPVAVDADASHSLLNLVLEKLMLSMQQSQQHIKPRFVLH